jgi:hypothetical protein
MDLNLSSRTVDRIVKKWEETGSYEPYHGSQMGRKSILTPREKSIIIREARKDPKATASEIKMNVGPVGEKVSRRTVNLVLQSAGLRAYRPVKKPLLTTKHKTERLRWAREHSQWTIDDWSKVRNSLTKKIIFLFSIKSSHFCF